MSLDPWHSPGAHKENALLIELLTAVAFDFATLCERQGLQEIDLRLYAAT